MDIKEKIERLPTSCGVYIFIDRGGNYLYIGKGENIRKRVKSHLTPPFLSPKKDILARKTSSIDYLITPSEVDALVLECNLIKEYKPRYNISLRDDKKYPYIRINLAEEFPTICLTRELTYKKARYFGPYTDAKAMRRTLRLLRKTFAFKICKKKKIDKKACLDYYIGRCIGPCSGRIKKEDYMEIVKEVIMFLEGRVDHLLTHLGERMNEASKNYQYELAGRLRDQIEAIKKTSSPQRVSTLKKICQDYVGYAKGENKAFITLLKVRAGKLVEKQNFHLNERLLLSKNEAISSFLKQYYSFSFPLPHEIIIPVFIEEENLIKRWLKEVQGKEIKITVPKRGDKKKMLEVASNNAEYQLKEGSILKSDRYSSILMELKKRLNLPLIPSRIEAVDISNIMGKNAVGSVVVFEKGNPKKDEWRKFKIKCTREIPSHLRKRGGNDYQMMAEVIERRYQRVQDENRQLPGLILVDGGGGQVAVAKKVLNQLGIKNIPIIGLAKGENRIHTSFSQRTLKLDPHIASFRFLVFIRDEAHRFAHSYYQKLKKKEIEKSLGEKIPMIGKKLNQEILRYFGSWEKVKNSSPYELMRVKGIGEKKANTIFNFFKKHSPITR